MLLVPQFGGGWIILEGGHINPLGGLLSAILALLKECGSKWSLLIGIWGLTSMISLLDEANCGGDILQVGISSGKFMAVKESDFDQIKWKLESFLVWLMSINQINNQRNFRTDSISSKEWHAIGCNIDQQIIKWSMPKSERKVSCWVRPDFEAEKEIIIIRNLEDLDEKSLINFFSGLIAGRF